MAFKQTLTSKTLTGYCKVFLGKSSIKIKIYQKDNKKSKKGSDVYLDPVSVSISNEDFFNCIPEGITDIVSDRKYFISLPSASDGDVVEKIYQFRPWMADEMVVKFTGFYKKDDGEIVFNKGFNNEDQLLAIMEFRVTQGDWKGALYPYRYWNVTDKKGEPVFKVVDGDLNFGWLPNAMQKSLELTGLMERQPSFKGDDTDDPQEILPWLEKQMLKGDVELVFAVNNGYPDMATLALYEGGDGEDAADDDDEDEKPAPKKSKVEEKPVAAKKTPRKFDEDDDE